jgi:hypothetical protein
MAQGHISLSGGDIVLSILWIMLPPKITPVFISFYVTLILVVVPFHPSLYIQPNVP